MHRTIRGSPDRVCRATRRPRRSEEHTSELQSPCNIVCRLLLEKKKITFLHYVLAWREIPTSARQWGVRTYWLDRHSKIHSPTGTYKSYTNIMIVMLSLCNRIIT